jgi:hypothetical protein
MSCTTQALLYVRQKAAQVVAAGAGVLVALPALASDPIADPVVTTLTAASTTVSLIGVASLAVFVTIKVFKWARRAL